MCNMPNRAARRHRARRLLALHRERLAVEAALLANGCTFRGLIELRHSRLSRLLDRLEAAYQRAWQEAA